MAAKGGRNRMLFRREQSAKPDPWKDVWVTYSLNDATQLDSINRIVAHKMRIIMSGCGFEEAEAVKALESPDPEDKEEVARWLRWELKRLDILQQQAGKAPVLTEQTLSRIVISDLALTLLQRCEKPPGSNLVYLIAELLGVDRHRTALSDKHQSKRWRLSNITAELRVLGLHYSDRQLAKKLGVSPTTIAEWKRDPDFDSRVAIADQLIREHLPEIRAERPGISDGEALNQVWERERRRQRGASASH
jgi:DNA-binding XRE family transcriptional regulator